MQLFGCYRKGDANDPEVYTAAVAAIFSEYPASIVDYVCDPRTGLPRRSKWLPTIAEITEACDARTAYVEAIAGLSRIAEQNRAIIADPDASEQAKARAQNWLDHCRTLKRVGE
ncbi:hypothetical protein [Bradyrhizobium sp.]|uniref:hypothetical protein n=1 Tax=Bradyrhizobium sp. TaxID=376 RepID=UPI003C478414